MDSHFQIDIRNFGIPLCGTTHQLYHVAGRALVAALFGTIFLPVTTVAMLARVALIIAYQMALPRQGMNGCFSIYSGWWFGI